MAKDYGPWVRHDWCERCSKRTEQTRWHRRLHETSPGEPTHGLRCNECAGEVPLGAT